jgi:hypothetical protein
VHLRQIEAARVVAMFESPRGSAECRVGTILFQACFMQSRRSNSFHMNEPLAKFKKLKF